MLNVLLKVLLDQIVLVNRLIHIFQLTLILGPEESESTNIGAIYTMGNHSVAVDWFSTEIDGIITTITVQDIIDASILGASLFCTVNFSRRFL